MRGRSRALSFALRPEAGRTATVARTAIVFETPGVRLAAGRGGDPLVWGTGLLGRQAALRLPVPKTTRGEDPMAPRAGVPAAIEPQLGGKGAFAGAQFSAAPGIRFFGGRFLRAVDGGALLLRGDWLSGMLIRARGHGPAAADLWLRRARSGEAQEFELLRDGAGEWSRGMRAARAGRWPGGGPLLWLDGQARRWSAGAPRAARSSEESWLAASSRIGMGLRGDRLAVGLSASEEARRPRSGSSAARRTRRAGGTLRGRIGEEGVARLRVDASASGRPTATGQVHGWSPWQWNHRWRARADVRAPATASAIQRFDGEWGIEAGWERSWRRQEERTDRARGSSWGGAWLGTRSGSRRWSAGLIEILSRSGLDLSPVWCAGARSRLRSGLVIAGAFDWRRGPWSVSCRALRPLLSPAGARALVHLAAGLDLERDARGIAGERAVADPAPRDADAGDGPEERRGEEVGGTSLVREKEIPP